MKKYIHKTSYIICWNHSEDKEIITDMKNSIGNRYKNILTCDIDGNITEFRRYDISNEKLIKYDGIFKEQITFITQQKREYCAKKYNFVMFNDFLTKDERIKICTTLYHKHERNYISEKDKSEMGKGLRDSKNKSEYSKALSNVLLTAREQDIIE